MLRFLFATFLSGAFALQFLPGGAGAGSRIESGTHVHRGGVSATHLVPDRRLASGDANARQHPDGPAQGVVPLPCDRPASAASCDVIMPCSVTFLAATRTESRTVARATLAAKVAADLEPHSRTQAPEPPPPRAQSRSSRS